MDEQEAILFQNLNGKIEGRNDPVMTISSS